MPCETARLLNYQSYQQWISSEFLSFGWFFTLGVLAVFYVVWIKLVDKSRLRDFIVLGSLSAIGFILADMILQSSLGVAEYKFRTYHWSLLYLLSVLLKRQYYLC